MSWRSGDGLAQLAGELGQCIVRSLSVEILQLQQVRDRLNVSYTLCLIYFILGGVMHWLSNLRAVSRYHGDIALYGEQIKLQMFEKGQS